MKKIVFFFSFLILSSVSFSAPYKSKAWVSDLGNGRYKNPVLNADYPEPDICQHGDNYYMVSSSGHNAPALPILTSKDLVNWQFVNYVIPSRHELLATPLYKRGFVNPSIRAHKGSLYVFFANPDTGIYMSKTDNLLTGWEEPVLVMEGKNLSSPCPIWDEKDNLLLVHGYEQKLPGQNNLIALCKVGKNMKAVSQSEIIIYDGNEYGNLRGTKIIKKNDNFYIFATVGKLFDHKVLCLRSKKITGPYEAEIAMYQASSKMEGPYFGAYIETPAGESWYMHNQHVFHFGNPVMLDPVKWTDGWPVVGGYTQTGMGEPITNHKKPSLPQMPFATPFDDDNFSGNSLNPQWQWNGQPETFWYFLNKTDKKLRLYSNENNGDLRTSPNILLQKLPAQAFSMTTKMTLSASEPNMQCGIVLLGKNYAQICLKSTPNDNIVAQNECQEGRTAETQNQRNIIKQNEIFFRLKVREDLTANFSYSLDGEIYYVLGKDFTLSEMDNLGARIGFFCTHPENAKNIGWCDIEYVEFTK